MTEMQRMQLVELRKNGLGYKRIGTQIGLSRDIVRNYCKSVGMVGHANEMIRKKGDLCKYCGGELIKKKTGRPAQFCCDECRRKWWKAHPERINKGKNALYEIKCGYCGKMFISYGNSKRKYCSSSCYIDARFWSDEIAQEGMELCKS